MGVKGWNVAVLVAIGAIWFCGTTQREKPVVGNSSHTGRVGALETKAAANPNDPAAVRELVQAYLDINQPGMAIGTIERATPDVRRAPTVEHLYARALLEQGRSGDALAAEKRVLAACADPSNRGPDVLGLPDRVGDPPRRDHRTARPARRRGCQRAA